MPMDPTQPEYTKSFAVDQVEEYQQVREALSLQLATLVCSTYTLIVWYLEYKNPTESRSAHAYAAGNLWDGQSRDPSS